MTATLPRPSSTIDEPLPRPRPRRISLSLAGGVATLPELEHNLAAKLNVRAHALRAFARVAVLLALDVTVSEVLRTVTRVARGCTVDGCLVASRVGALFPHGYGSATRFGVALVIGMLATGTYGPGDRRRDPQRILAACVLTTILPLWTALWTDPVIVGLQFALGAGLLSLAMISTRLGLDAALYRFAPAPLARTLLVGRAAECHEVWSEDKVGTRHGFTIVGSSATDGSGQLSTCEIRRAVAEANADTVMICGQLDDTTFANVVRASVMAECRVLATARRLDLPGVSPSVVWRRGRPLVEMRATSLRWQQLFLKRLLDLVLASVMLVCFAPIMLAVAIAMKLSSEGPLVYGQRRLGRYARDFKCYKFRSMFVDAEQRLKSEPALHAEYVRNGYKLPDGSDPRITPIGRFLRRTSLDELPQLWNVIRGDMSLVGPRPIVPDEIRHYDTDGQMLLLLKPGITGLWQVSGRSNLAYPERSNLELEYVERWTLGRDLGILLRTVPAVLAQRGAH